MADTTGIILSGLQALGDVSWSQDFAVYHERLPFDRAEVRRYTADRLVLTAPGYGDPSDYGNGPVFMYTKHLSKAMLNALGLLDEMRIRNVENGWQRDCVIKEGQRVKLIGIASESGVTYRLVSVQKQEWLSGKEIEKWVRAARVFNAFEVELIDYRLSYGEMNVLMMLYLSEIPSGETEMPDVYKQTLQKLMEKGLVALDLGRYKLAGDAAKFLLGA